MLLRGATMYTVPILSKLTAAEYVRLMAQPREPSVRPPVTETEAQRYERELANLRDRLRQNEVLHRIIETQIVFTRANLRRARRNSHNAGWPAVERRRVQRPKPEQGEQ